MKTAIAWIALSAAAAAAPWVLAAPGDDAALDPELRPPVRIEAAGKPIDTEIGHAAPLVTDWNGDGKRDLLVGQFGGGVLWIFLNEGTDAAPRLAAGTRFQAAGGDGTVPTG